MLRFHIADIAKDGHILNAARDIAQKILDSDPGLVAPEHTRLREVIGKQEVEAKIWGKIS
jgi:ATP-dependent DNA helicase RecG